MQKNNYRIHRTLQSTGMKPTVNFLSQAQVCIEQVVRAKRQALLDAWGTIDLELKGDESPVTVLDKQLEAELREALLTFDSSIGIEGEEYGIEGDRNTFWLVDPIDGTENFVRGLPFVRNMVTLVSNGEPVYAFVYKPITDELYTASKGHGTFCNGQAVHVSQRPLNRAWVELSVPLDKPEVFSVVSAVQPLIAGFRRIGEFTYVAEGKVDAQLVYKSGGGAWDYAPRALLVSEAGGRVANIGSDTYDYRNNDVLMANPVIFDALMRAISSVA